MGVSAGVSALLLAVAPVVVAVARHLAVRGRRASASSNRALRVLAGVDVGERGTSTPRSSRRGSSRAVGPLRTVRRELPDRVVLQVREHRPVAILAVADEAPGLYYLAANGRIFAPVTAGDARDLPFVTGLTRKDLAGDDAFGPRAVRRALALLRQADRRPSVGTVSELHVDRDEDDHADPAVPITIGWGDYGLKLARVAEVLPSDRRETEIARSAASSTTTSWYGYAPERGKPRLAGDAAKTAADGREGPTSRRPWG
jgi:cell division protein FtsQ